MEQLLKINIPYSREQKHVSVTNWIELVTLGVKNKSRPNELKKKLLDKHIIRLPSHKSQIKKVLFLKMQHVSIRDFKKQKIWFSE